MASPRPSNKNRFGVGENIVHAPRSSAQGYAYRTGLPIFQSAEYGHFMDDFAGPVASNLPGNWTAVVKDTNATITTTTSTTMTNTNRAHGVIEFAGTLASDGAAIYRPKAFVFDSGYSFYIECRMACDTPAEQYMQFGLSSLTATTNPEDLYTTAADSLISFGTAASASVVSLIYDKANAGPVTDTYTLPTAIAASTWTVFGLEYRGGATPVINAYVNGDLVINSSTSANVPNGVLLAPFVAIRNGATTTAKGWVDWFRYGTDR